MNKCEFLANLRDGLSGLPREDIEERLLFYSEMIDDRMEEGLSEGEAVATIDPVDEIVTQVIEGIPFVRLAKERMKPKRRLTGWEIALLMIGSPIWLSLGVAAAAVVLSLYILLWSVIISLWAVFASLAACSVGGILACAIFATVGNGVPGVAMLAAGMIFTGLSIFAFYGCKAATKGTVMLTKKIAMWIKHCFMGKEVAQ